MEFEAKKYTMQGLLEKAATVLATKDVTPILKNFSFRFTKPDKITVIATDTALSVIATTELAKVDMDGTIVFPGQKLLDLVRSAPDDMMRFIIDGQQEATISCSRSKWGLKLMDSKEYPNIPDTESLKYTAIDRVAFLGAIQRTRPAAPVDTYRPQLSLINISNHKVSAADGVRFHQVDVAFDGNFQIPIAAVDDLVKFLKVSEDANVNIAETDNHIVFKFGEDTFIATKATAEFPDLEGQLLKPAIEGNKFEVGVDRQQLVDGVKRVRLTADQDTNLITMDLSTDVLTLSAKDKFGNFATQDIDVSWKGDKRQLGVNCNFLLSTLQVVAGANIKIMLGEDGKHRKSSLLFVEPGFAAVLNQLRIVEEAKATNG